MEQERIVLLRMARQGFAQPIDEREYPALYRDMQPGRSVYWNGFGQPPTLTPRAAFDDGEYNRLRQRSRALVKVRLAGTVGWIEAGDMPLFAALYCKPIARMTAAQETLLALLRREGPLNIQQIKEETGWLVKEITPVLQRLQEAFCVYEDQCDGEWDREWYLIGEMFPALREAAPDRAAALAEVMRRFARRMAAFTEEEARSFFRLPVREIRAALAGPVERLLYGLSGGGRSLCRCGVRVRRRKRGHGAESLSRPAGKARHQMGAVRHDPRRRFPDGRAGRYGARCGGRARGALLLGRAGRIC